jgi:hypothetical protein
MGHKTLAAAARITAAMVALEKCAVALHRNLAGVVAGLAVSSHPCAISSV